MGRLEFDHADDDRRAAQYVCPACPASGGRRPGAVPVDALAERSPLELTRGGLTWLHFDRADHDDGRAARRAVRLARARRRGRALEASAPEDRRVPRVHLRRAPLPGLRQGDPAPERGRARLLPRAGLPRHAAERRAAAGHAPVPALRGGRRAARGAVREGLRPPAVRGARRPLRLLLPDPRQDRPQARHGRGRHVRAARRGRRARPLERKQEIISYRKIIKPERATLRLLERRVERFLPEELDLYFDDIVDGAERIWDLLDNYKEVVEALESTNESVISHRQNDVLRVLTVFSAILLPMTLIASIFGMNVDFPGSGTAARSG